MSDFVERIVFYAKYFNIIIKYKKLIVQSNENNQLDIELDEDTRKDLSSELVIMKNNIQKLINDYIKLNCIPSKIQDAKEMLNAAVNEFTENIGDLFKKPDEIEKDVLILNNKDFSNKNNYSTPSSLSLSKENSNS